MQRIRILLADDHLDFLAVEARLLEPEFDVVETVGDGRSSIEAAARLEPDILVLDIAMPEMDGMEVARRLHESGSPVKIVFLSAHDDPDYVRAAMSVGGLGYVVECRLALDLLPALRQASEGRSFVSPGIALG